MHNFFAPDGGSANRNFSLDDLATAYPEPELFTGEENDAWQPDAAEWYGAGEIIGTDGEFVPPAAPAEYTKHDEPWPVLDEVPPPNDVTLPPNIHDLLVHELYHSPDLPNGGSTKYLVSGHPDLLVRYIYGDT